MGIQSRRRFLCLTVVPFAAACAQVRSPAAPENQVPAKYLFAGTAAENTTVLDAVTAAGHKVESVFYPGMGRLIVAINEDARPWRIDVNGNWFALDAASQRIRAGEVWGCFPG